MLLEVFLALALIIPGLSLTRLLSFKIGNLSERLTISYIFSLTIIFIISFVGGALFSLSIAIYVITIVVVLSFCYLLFSWVRNPLRTNIIQSLTSELRSKRNILWISLICLISTYAIILLSRALLDSDVVQSYLPFAREMVKHNGFTYTTGSDFNVSLRPIGVSIFYAWAYIISGSLASESFRLMPLTPIIILVLLTYEIVKEVKPII